METSKFAICDGEIQAYFNMLLETRRSRRNDNDSPGSIFSPTFPSEEAIKDQCVSISVSVWDDERLETGSNRFTFECDVSTRVGQVLEKTLEQLGIQKVEGEPNPEFMLRVHGLQEYLRKSLPISDFRYAQECMKLGKDVKLVLVEGSSVNKPSLGGTLEDDSLCSEMRMEEIILPGRPEGSVTFTDISGFLKLVQKESNKIRRYVSMKREHDRDGSEEGKGSPPTPTLNPTLLIQPVKGVCALLGNFQTVGVTNSLERFRNACSMWNYRLKGKLCKDEVLEDSVREFVFSALDQIKESMNDLVGMYSKSFPVSFQMRNELNPEGQREKVNLTEYSNQLLRLRIGSVHRLHLSWISTYLDFYISVEVYHGTTLLAGTKTTHVIPSESDSSLFFPSIVYDRWVELKQLPLHVLPRECCVVLTLFGRKLEDEITEVLTTDELGWSSIYCFDFKGELVQGDQVLTLWSNKGRNKTFCPAPNSTTFSDNNFPLISIELPEYSEDICFPERISSAAPYFREFSSLKTKELLNNIIENCNFPNVPPNDKRILWENRHHLYLIPNALPKVLLSARDWDCANLPEIYALLEKWAPMEPIDALQLLLPCFPDAKVREQAISWISKMNNDELVHILPQLVEALSYECHDISQLAKFLLKRSLDSLEVAHGLFWILASYVGLGRWESELNKKNTTTTNQAISLRKSPTHRIFPPKRQRLELLLNSLMLLCGSQWRSLLIAEYKMTEMLSDIATKVKHASSSSRDLVLMHGLHMINELVFNGSEKQVSLPLPLSPSYLIRGIEVESCHSFSSASVPIKVNFLSGLPEGGTIPVLFKKGDDLRQDMLTIQIIRVIEKWWLNEGLNLRVLTFSCVPTGFQQGMVEIVSNSETLCKIQAEYGLTGAFQDRPIADWLTKMNPNPEEYERSVENFTVSCAAYCVLTYVLGVGDRHNDNIMLTCQGHLFHIDFGKFLGDFQRIGTFNRDRTPFVLTSDMVFVISDGGRSPQNFHRFVDLCCEAFRIVRKNGNALVNLLGMMSNAGIMGVDFKAVAYIQAVLLPDCSNQEAADKFTRFIKESWKNWFTPVNFFLHSLGQLKFQNGSEDKPTTLSFVPQTYSIADDGPITSAKIIGFKKMHNVENIKYYSYLIEVKRHTEGAEEDAAISIVNRTYEDFLELYQKLCIIFPQHKKDLKKLGDKSSLTWQRLNVKQTEKRKLKLQKFLGKLFLANPEVSRSNLVYTFFHVLAKDEHKML